MATDASFMDYIVEQAGFGALLTHRKMFGEYALYLHGKVVGFACDNQLFLKPTPAGAAVLGQPVEGFPYPGAKPHWLIDATLDDPPLLHRLLACTADALPAPKPKAAKPAKPAKQAKATPPR